jgi:hypothetical protein
LNNSIKKIGKFVRSNVIEWTKDNYDIDKWNLAGACAIASYTLYKCLIKLKYKPKFIVAEGCNGAHCWLELDNYVIDLTATQFNMALPKVLITNKNYYFKAIPELKSYYEVKVNRSAIKSTRTWNQQSPIIYNKEIRKIIRNLNEQSFK